MATPFSTSNKQPSQQEIQPLLNLLNAGQLAATANMAQTLIAQYPNTFLLHNVLGIALDGLVNMMAQSIAIVTHSNCNPICLIYILI